MRGDSTIVDRHHTLQIAMGWSDAQLHRFINDDLRPIFHR
jgi:hypothetical protein